MDKLTELEKTPVKQIHDVMVAITGEGLIPKDKVMSNTVYLKNLCNTLIKQTTQSKKQDPQTLHIKLKELLDIIRLLVQGVLSPALEMKYKHHMTLILNRLFFQIQQMDQSAQQTDSFTLLSEFVTQIRNGVESQHHETKIGALYLTECAFTVAHSPDKFQMVFENLQLALCDTA